MQHNKSFILKTYNPMSYTIKKAVTTFEGHNKVASVEIQKSTFPFFWRKPKPMRHKVFFDMYDKAVTHKVYDWYVMIDKDWVDLKAKHRKQIMDLLIWYFASDYTVGNFRNTLKKV